MSRRRRVYIAGPISRGDLAHNINQASAAFVALTQAGFAPFCPHWSAYSGEAIVKTGSGTVYAIAGATPNALKHSDWLAVDLEWVAVADAVLRLPGESIGADREVNEARALGIPVYESMPELLAGSKTFAYDPEISAACLNAI